MVEQVRVNPTEVRGYGNICEGHTLEDFIVSNSGLAKEKETVHGALTDVYKLVYSLYGLMFAFDNGNKQLYLQMGEADILSFGFDDDSKQLYLLDMARTGLSLGFDEDTNELYITDAPPIVHNYTLALDSESYTTSGSLSVSATLLDDGVPVSGATVSFTGGTSTVTSTTDSSGVATATVNFTSSGTLTATYSNVSDTATITVPTGYIFYDACDTDNTNLYDTTTNWTKSSFTFDSSNSCYAMSRTSSPSGMCTLWIKDLTVTDQVKITVDMKIGTSGSVNTQGGPLVMNSAKNKGFLAMIESWRSSSTGEYSLGTINAPTGSHGTKVIADQSLGVNARNYWLTYELIIDGSSVELNIYNGSTLIKTGTITSSQLDSTGNIVGLLMSYDSGAKISVKNLKVEAL